MQFEIDDEQIQASAKKELEIAVSGLIKDTITGYQFTAKLRDRVRAGKFMPRQSCSRLNSRTETAHA